MPGALEAFQLLSQWFDTYILSTPPWQNPDSWKEKREWVDFYLGHEAHKRLILSHNKHLNKGHFLIDDRLKNGAAEFEGELILFGSDPFPNWETTIDYLSDKA